MLCADHVMTFTASGEIFTHLLVDRGKNFKLSNKGLLASLNFVEMYRLKSLERSFLSAHF